MRVPKPLRPRFGRSQAGKVAALTERETRIRPKPISQQVVGFGASSGIGRATAHRFAERGAKVVVSARGAEGLDTLVEEIRLSLLGSIALGALIALTLQKWQAPHAGARG